MNDRTIQPPTHDPLLEALLDRELACAAADPELERRILLATAARLPRAKLRYTTRLRLIAAGLILAMQAGIWATILAITHDARAIVDVGSDLSRLDRIALAVAPIDAELSLLSARVDAWRPADDAAAIDALLDDTSLLEELAPLHSATF